MIFTNKQYGLDNVIAAIQSQLERKLPWIDTVGTNDVLIYGLLETTQRENGAILEGYNGKDYIEIFHNDKKSAIIGFKKNDLTINNYVLGAELDVICTCNLVKIHKNKLRDKERAKLEIYTALGNYYENITDIKETNSEVFSGFDLNRILYKDIQPYYTFSFTIEVTYKNDLC